jgi:hypothetical protein
MTGYLKMQQQQQQLVFVWRLEYCRKPCPEGFLK